MRDFQSAWDFPLARAVPIATSGRPHARQEGRGGLISSFVGFQFRRAMRISVGVVSSYEDVSLST